MYESNRPPELRIDQEEKPNIAKYESRLLCMQPSKYNRLYPASTSKIVRSSGSSHLQPLRTHEMQVFLGEKPRNINDYDNRCASLLVPPVEGVVGLTPRRTHELLRTQMKIRPSTTSQKVKATVQPITPRLQSLPASQSAVQAKRQLFSGEKSRVLPQRDQEWLTQKAVEVELYLEKSGRFDAVLARGLRKMTLKDTVNIILFFASHAGIHQQQSVPPKPVEFIINALEQLGYPYRVNRTLLTPPFSSQHAFSHLMCVLDFLIDFAPPAEGSASYEFEFIGAARDESVFVSAANCYAGWSAAPRKQQQLVTDGLINEKCNINSMLALVADIARLMKLEKSIEEEKSKYYMQSNIKELQQLHAHLFQLKTQLSDCKSQLEILKQESSDLKKCVKCKSVEIECQRKILAELKQNVEQQACSLDAYNLMDEEERYAELQLRRRQCQELSERIHLQNLQLKRARKELLMNIEAFNVHMRDLWYSSVFKVDSEIELELPLWPTMEQIAERRQLLQSLGNAMKSRMQQFQHIFQRQQSEQTEKCTPLAEQSQLKEDIAQCARASFALQAEIKALNQKLAALQ